MYVSRMPDNRFRVEFTSDTVAYFNNETLPDSIKYAIASKGHKTDFDSVFDNLNQLFDTVYLDFTVEEVQQLMKEAGLGHG